MDRRGTRGRRTRGRPRRDPGRDAGSENSEVGSGNEVHARPGRSPNQVGLEEPIAAGIERGIRAAGQGRDLGGHAAQPGDVDDPFYRLYNTFIQLGPPRFQEGNIEAAEEWLASIKDNFQICRAREDYRVELAAHFLENAARFWWENTKLNFAEEQGAIPRDWFEEKFKEEIVGELRIEEMSQRFMNLKQEGRTVTEYNTDFVSLSRYAPDIQADVKRYKRHYIDGLRRKIVVIVDNPSVQKLQKLMDYAAQIEAHHKKEDEEEQTRNVRQKGSKGQHPNRDKGEGSGSSMPVVKVEEKPIKWCRRCNKPRTC